MATNQNTTKNNQSEQDLNNRLDELLNKAKKVNQEIDANTKETNEAMAELEAKVDEGVAKVEQIYSDLDNIKREASDELDELILQEAADLDREEQ